MANTTTMKDGVINITLDGAADWSWDSSTEITSVPELNELNKLGKIFIKSIAFEPSAANDKVSVRTKSLTGPKFFIVSCADTNDQKIQYYDREFSGIYIAAADVTSSSSAILIIVLM